MAFHCEFIIFSELFPHLEVLEVECVIFAVLYISYSPLENIFYITYCYCWNLIWTVGSWRRHCCMCLVVDLPCNCSMQFKAWLVGSNLEQSLTDWYLNTMNRKIVSLITFSNLLNLVSKWYSVHAHTFPCTNIQNLLSSFLIFFIYN